MTNFAIKHRLKELIKIASIIPRDLLAREPNLMVHKWPAYRFMSPIQATRLFRDEYVKAYKAYHRKNFDLEESKKIKITSNLDMLRPNAHLTQLWKARQLADELGLLYPEYLNFAFDFAARRKRRYAPQPNQLGPNDKNREAWWAKLDDFWTDERRRIALSRMTPMPQFAVENDRLLPGQRRFRKELLADAKASPGNIDMFIGRYVMKLRYLTKEDCEPLGAKVVGKALEQLLREPAASEFAPHDHQTIEPGMLFQSCFGVPGINNDEPVCQNCPSSDSCSRVRNRLLEKIEEMTGTVNPLEEERKRKNRERVARHRARRRAEKNTS